MTATLPVIERDRPPGEKLLEEFKLEGVFPVPLESIAKQLGYDCVVFDPDQNPPLKEVAGMVNYETKKIFVNGNDNVFRQRFTLAHEIGHVRLHEGKSLVDFRKNIEQPTTPTEIEANQFAADLLMPSLPFIKTWLGSGGNVDYLKKRFGVSDQAVKVRIRTLRLDRA